MRVIGFTGFAQSGKDTAVNILVQERGVKRVAFADPMRGMLYALNPIIEEYPVRLQELVDSWGWDVAKVKFPEIRQLLQRLGTEGGRAFLGENIWVEAAFRQVRCGENVAFSDCRFENEARAVRDAGGQVWKIQRNGVGAVNEHVSDKGLPDELIDCVIENNGTVEDLKRAVLVQYDNFQ